MINQVHISESLAHFADGFKKRWGLVDYHDTEAPALFVGIYFSTDVEAYNKHKGFKLVLFGGADIPNVRRLNKPEIVICRSFYEHSLKKYYHGRIKHFITVPFKDYSKFKVEPLGDKIYCYQAFESDSNKRKYRYDLLQGVINHFGADRVLIGYKPHTIKEMIKDYYKPSFVNLQFNVVGGFTSSMEMAHMGRASVSNHGAGFCMGYGRLDTEINEVIENIETIELNGTKKFQNAIAKAAKDYANVSRDWLDENFWK